MISALTVTSVTFQGRVTCDCRMVSTVVETFFCSTIVIYCLHGRFLKSNVKRSLLYLLALSAQPLFEPNIVLSNENPTLRPFTV